MPIALSFVLRSLSNATLLQCFTAGAALCSTSLGTTFTVLGTSGLLQSRLGVVLTSAAMMDDVVGLIMVQVISNLGWSGTSVSAVTVLRPLLASLGFAVFTPILCTYIVKPMTLWINSKRVKSPTGYVNQALRTRQAAIVVHTLTLLGYTTAASYAGISNLFAAYLAGVAITWWDAEVPHVLKTEGPASSSNRVMNGPAQDTSGASLFTRYYAAPVSTILKPFFFVCAPIIASRTDTNKYPLRLPLDFQSLSLRCSLAK